MLLLCSYIFNIKLWKIIKDYYSKTSIKLLAQHLVGSCESEELKPIAFIIIKYKRRKIRVSNGKIQNIKALEKKR